MSSERAYQLRSPIDGRVTAIQGAVGRAVEMPLPLMTIVPTRTDLKVSLFAPSRAIGFVEEGQEVRVLYDAFPYQRYGSGEATIRQVSRTAIAPADLQAPFRFDEPVYYVEASLRRQTVTAFGRDHHLQPGMTLRANIILDRSSFADWLFRPLRAVMKRSDP